MRSGSHDLLQFNVAYGEVVDAPAFKVNLLDARNDIIYSLGFPEVMILKMCGMMATMAASIRLCDGQLHGERSRRYMHRLFSRGTRSMMWMATNIKNKKRPNKGKYPLTKNSNSPPFPERSHPKII